MAGAARGDAMKAWLRFLLAALIFASAGFPAIGRDLGQWDKADPFISKWFKGLMQPDNPIASCCGTSDAYWADEYDVEGDHYIATITDERDDAPLRRQHIDPGTKVVVPNNKIKWDAGNPTGHGVLFVGPSGIVYCYVAPGGV